MTGRTRNTKRIVKSKPSEDEPSPKKPSPEKPTLTPSRALASSLNSLTIQSPGRRTRTHGLVVGDVNMDVEMENDENEAPTGSNRKGKKLFVKDNEVELTSEIKQRLRSSHPVIAKESIRLPRVCLSEIKKTNKQTQVAIKKNSNHELMSKLRSVLHTSEVPSRLPCREKEFADIENFIESSIAENGSSKAMYISGVPGTGKTASTLAVVNKLQKKSKKKFIFVHVNAMELVEPKNIYIQVYQGVTGDDRRISANNACKKLASMFEMIDRKRPPVIILVDELDQLLTKRQEIVYQIFNWTGIDDARVSVISIANTLDLPERVFSQKISSRLGSNRLLFQPYTFEQISQIIEDRLTKYKDVIANDTIQLASRKVAAVSGDMRKAMDYLRRATEIALEKNADLVELTHVTEVSKEMANVPRVHMVSSLPRHAFILFKSITNRLAKTGQDEVLFYDVYREYCIQCSSSEGIMAYHSLGVHSMVLNLCSSKLINASSGLNLMRRRIRLGMAHQDAMFAIKHTEEMISNGLIEHMFVHS